MFNKICKTGTEQNTELMRNRHRKWKWFYLLPFTFYLLPAFFTGCKKEKPVIKVDEKYDYGTFYADGLTSNKWVALTFDDGPNPRPLDKILDTLKKENVKATFFVLGINIVQFPKSAKKYLEYGHQVGNHTYTHFNYYQLKKKKTTDEIEKILNDEMNKTEEAIKNAMNIKPFFMRMPNGFITSLVKKVAKEKKYMIINWTFGCDWQKNTKEELVKKYLKNIRPGAIFLFHEKEITAEALPEIIDGIKKKGYEIVSLKKILGITGN